LNRLERCLTPYYASCALNVVTAGEAREVEGCRDCSNRLLDGAELEPDPTVLESFGIPFGQVSGVEQEHAKQEHGDTKQPQQA